MYHSKKFPTVNEITGLVNLIITMKETYKFVHPLDLRDKDLITKEGFDIIDQDRRNLLNKLNEFGISEKDFFVNKQGKARTDLLDKLNKTGISQEDFSKTEQARVDLFSKLSKAGI